MTIFRPLGLAGLTASLALMAMPTFAQPTDAASDTFDQGVELLRRGRKEEALSAFQKVLAMDLSNERAYELWKSTEFEIWLEMLSAEGDIELVTKRLMAMAKTSVNERRDDPDAIRSLLSTISKGSVTARLAAVRTLSSEHGEYAVQYMITSLNGEASTDHRVLFMQALTAMGDDVVLPLCAALDSPDAMQRRNIALTLGRISDSRAAAYLARCAETDAEEGVRKAATEALAQCGGASRGAASAFNRLGHEYHLSNMSVLRADQVSSVVWRFRGGKLAGTSVPSYLYAQELAKGAYYGALRVEPGSDVALSGLVRCLASQLQIIADRQEAGLEVGAEADAVQAGMLAVAAAGRNAVDRALQVSLTESDSMSVIGICRAAQQGLVSAGPGLEAALGSDDAVVRAEAALALAAQSANGQVSAKVIGTLGQAAGRRIARIAAVIDGDAARAQQTVAGLEAQGMVVNHWATGAKGLASLYRVPGLDVILVADSLTDMTCDQVLTEIQESSRFGETPVMVLSNSAEMADDLYGSRSAGIIAGGDLSSVAGVLSDSLGKDRERADALSRRSSNALAQLAGQGANVSIALKGLMATLSNGRPDAVTLPALVALGAAGGADEAAAVASLSADDSASDDVRKGAAMACAKMFGRGIGGDSAMNALFGVVQSDASLAVRSAAASALGRLNLNPEMRAELMRLVRSNVGE